MNNLIFMNQLSRFDKVGILGSTLCTIHCIALPLLAIISPRFFQLFHNEWIHIGILLTLIPVAFLAFRRGYKKHNRLVCPLLGLFSISILLSAVLCEKLPEGLHTYEKPLTILGSTFLILAHLANSYFIKQSIQIENPEDCPCCSHE